MAISVRGLVKHYGLVKAVDGIDLEIEQGEVFGLLGPNGAGKSTTVEILEGHRTRTAGDVAVLGFDPGDAPREFRERIGIVLQETAIEGVLTVREALDFYGSIYPQRRSTAELLEIVELVEKRDARVKTLSGGQRRRLELALGLVGDPELVFLDEPTTGFDPAARRRAWTVVENLAGLGKTILLTTHYMDEAEQLADRLAVMRRGEIVAEGAPASIGRELMNRSIIRFTLPHGTTMPLAVSRYAHMRGGQVEMTVEDPRSALHALTGWALEIDTTLDDLEVTRPTLEDVYLSLVGEEDGE